MGKKERRKAAEERVAAIQTQRKNACIARRRALRAEGVQGWPTNGCNISGCGTPCR